MSDISIARAMPAFRLSLTRDRFFSDDENQESLTNSHLFLAPEAVEATATSTSTVRLRITPHDRGEAVDHYKAFVGKPDSENICKVAASAATLECDITDLIAATQYTVGAQACLKGEDGCGKQVETTVTTPPPCKFHLG